MVDTLIFLRLDLTNEHCHWLFIHFTYTHFVIKSLGDIAALGFSMTIDFGVNFF